MFKEFHTYRNKLFKEELEIYVQRVLDKTPKQTKLKIIWATWLGRMMSEDIVTIQTKDFDDWFEIYKPPW